MSNLYFDNVVQVGQLYLEYVFFEFESEPILFTCHDQLNQTYLCLCSDIRYGQKWIISKCNTKILRALITAEIDIVTAFLKQQKAIVVVMDMNGEEESYEINTKEIDPLDLPKPGTFIRCNKAKAQNYLLQKEARTTFLRLKQTKHEIDIKEPKKKFPYMNKNDSVSSLMNEEYSYKEDNSNIDIRKAKISYAA